MRNSLQDKRNKELEKIYQNIISSSHVNISHMSTETILNMVANHPAPRFYITPKMAERYVLGFKRQDPAILNSRKLPMILDLVEVYDRIVARKKRDLRFVIWECVVQSAAKSFYVTPRRIREIIFKYF